MSKRVLPSALLILGLILPHATPSTLLAGAKDTRVGYGEQRAPVDGALERNKSYWQACWDYFAFFINGSYFRRHLPERNPDVRSDLQYLDQMRYEDEYGLISSRFMPDLDTRVYFSATAAPDENGVVPMVDPKAKALFVYFHGTGTENGSGANFNYKANKLAHLGYASLAFDYPYHQNGSANPMQSYAGNWMKQVHAMIQKVRVPGQPVYLVGHSFGVNAGAEYLYRYPDSVNGALLMSPGGINKDLLKWSQEKTIPMLKTFPNFDYNPLGARWAGMMRRTMIWNQPENHSLRDPTIRNPNLKVRVVSGAWEEYIPGPLDANGLPTKEPRTYDLAGAMRKYLAKADVHIEPGVGHLVFKHVDAEGNDMVIREILNIAGESIANTKQLQLEASKQQNLAFSQKLLASYELDPFFRDWIDAKYSKNQLLDWMRKGDEASARTVYDRYKLVRETREALAIQNALATKEWAPEFYEANKDVIDGYNKGKRDILLARYFEFLKAAPPGKYDRFTKIPANWYESVPEPAKAKPQVGGDQIFAQVLATETEDKAFFEANKAVIEAAKTDMKKRGQLIATFKRWQKEKANGGTVVPVAGEEAPKAAKP